MELSDDDKAGMTPDEIAALTDENATANLLAHSVVLSADEAAKHAEQAAAAAATAEAAAAAATPATAEAEATAAAAAVAAAAAGTPAAEGAATEPTLEEMVDALDLAEEETGERPLAQRPYTVDARDIKSERKAIETKLDDIDDKWTAGELTDAERKAQMRPLREQANDLLAEEAVQTALRTANEQTAATTLNEAINTVIAAAKKDGTIDYMAEGKKGNEAAEQFDSFLTMHQKQSPRASFADLAAKAHKSMLAFRGIAAAALAVADPAAAAAAATAEAARVAKVKADALAARARPAAPTATLAGVPAASPTGMENDPLEKFSQLEGEDAEDYLASLPEAEQKRIMHAADAQSMKASGDARGKRARAEARS